MLELTIQKVSQNSKLHMEIKKNETPKKHFKECFWQDRAGNISYDECPWCSIYKTYSEGIKK